MGFSLTNSVRVYSGSEPSGRISELVGRPTLQLGMPGFDAETIEALRKARISFTMGEYPPRTRLFPQGALSDVVFIVASGLVKLIHSNSDGKEIIVGIRPS